MGCQYLGGLKLGIEKKHMVNNLDIEKKKGLHIILWVTDILCVSDSQIAKNLEAFKISQLISTISSRLHCKSGKGQNCHV